MTGAGLAAETPVGKFVGGLSRLGQDAAPTLQGAVEVGGARQPLGQIAANPHMGRRAFLAHLGSAFLHPEIRGAAKTLGEGTLAATEAVPRLFL